MSTALICCGSLKTQHLDQPFITTMATFSEWVVFIKDARQ